MSEKQDQGYIYKKYNRLDEREMSANGLTNCISRIWVGMIGGFDSMEKYKWKRFVLRRRESDTFEINKNRTGSFNDLLQNG